MSKDVRKILRHIQQIVTLVCCLALLVGELAFADNSDLAEIIVTVSPEQVVNQPLLGTAQLLLLDSLSNPVTDYTLDTDPISLSVDEGTLTPDLLDNPALLINGLIDLIPLDVVAERSVLW